MTVLVAVTLAAALLPAVMTLINLLVLRTPSLPRSTPAIAILIPARDEGATIGPCIEAALGSEGADIEVIVLDDGSTDRTAEIVSKQASSDKRLRLETAPPLPRGWNGKQHACHVLSTLTSRQLLLFIDADVRLAPEGAARLASAASNSALVSGVPRQIMESWSERLVIPMINALILGYLPIPMMRRSDSPAFGAGCGQMIAVDRDAYIASGGHAAIRNSMHDGLKLPRLFRQSGWRTDLVDGTALASCRMYSDSAALFQGFLKNATEGMARPVALPIWTLLLFFGHVMPWILLLWAGFSGRSDLLPLIATACAAPLAARFLQAWRCRESMRAVLVYPAGVLLTLAMQWAAFFRWMAGRGTMWRGRVYQTSGKGSP